MEVLKLRQSLSRNDLVLRRIERQAAWRPRALAIRGRGVALTYAELDACANRLAHRLIGLGVGPEVPVAILAGRRPEAVVWALAVWKAGGCYLPLDPAHPEARLRAVLSDAGAPLLLAATDLLDRHPGLGEAGPRVLCPEAMGSELARESAADPDRRVEPGNLAYLIFTSGSTGRPKGVEVEHRGLANLVGWHLATYGVTPADRASCLAGPGFDAAVWEVWPYLAAGASLHLPPEELLLAPARLVAWLAAERITCAFLPTPLAEAVLDEPWPKKPQGIALRVLLTGGDRLHRRPRPGAPFSLYNHYGPTEGSVVTTAGLVEPALPDTGRPTIGRPIDGVTVRLSAGEEGELQIGGRGLARGYRGRPEATAERFVPDPAGGPGARCYRSGDLARLLPSGELDFVGRLDQQVKVRGVRIELGEIEAVLRRQPAVAAGAVLARQDGEGERRLVAYVALRPGAEASPEELQELRAALARELPEALVPSAWAFLPALPLTPNGKVDRAALADLVPLPARATAPRLPGTPTETGLVEIFRAVLDGVEIGVEDDFFALGGHSLKVAQTLSRVRARFGVELQWRALFDHPTAAALAARIETMAEASGAGEDEGPIPSVPRDGEIPLSPGQEGLWLLQQWAPGSAAYNTPFVLRLDGDLDREALGRAWSKLISRHESLRTAFPVVAGRPVQRILPPSLAPLPEVDLCLLPEPVRETEAERIATAAGRRPVDLTRGPAFSGLLLRLAPRRHHLLALFHHIVSDDWSIAVVLADLASLYQRKELPALSRQYADFAAWQRRRLTGARLDRLLGYWRERLAGAPQLLDLPGDRPRPRVQSFRGFRLAAPVPAELREALTALGRRQEASTFMTFLAAWGLFLGRLSGTTDLLVGAPVAGRGRLELEPLVGLLVNNLALRVELAGASTFPDLLGRVRESTLGALAHQELPFELLVEALRPAREPSHSPLVQVFFVLANAPKPPSELAPGLALSVREVETGTAKVDLSLYLEEREGELWTIWEASRDLFDRATIERLAAAFRTLLAGFVARPEMPPAELPLVGDAERAAVLLAEPPLESRGLLHEPFLSQAALTPHAVAVVCDNESLTYGELAQRAGRLAERLQAQGVGPEVPVAVFLPRTPDLIISLLGVLLSGGFYVPIDPGYPPERVSFLLEDSNARVVLKEGDLSSLPAGCAVPTPLTPENLSYLIYTSGSTGRPKAVAIQHGSASQRIAWAQKTFPSVDLSGVLAATSICFDLSVFEIFVPLSTGGTVILAENALALSSLPARDRVTLINTVPSALAGLLDRGPLPTSVAIVNLAGEPLPPTLAERIRAGRLLNLYGPSEDTTYSTWAVVEPARSPVIGRPLAGTRAAVRDVALQLLPAGVPGELCLSGEGLARGYRDRPDLTAARFVPDPDGPPGSRLYRTGDRVRLRADGELDYLGRLDRQVKLRGFRIEPGEIEAALARQPEVTEAVVAMREDRSGDRRLVAYGVAAPGARPETAELLRRLEAILPRPLVPSAVMLLERLPRTPNGKLDRAALPAPETSGAGSYRAPRTSDEARMAALWAEVLGVERVGVDDDFFALGGHSLLAARLAARLEEALGCAVPMSLLFEHRTVERLAGFLAPLGRTGTSTDEHERPDARVRPGGAPLSSGQRRLWFLDRLRPGGAAYNMPFALDLAGPFRAAALAQALAEVMRRHEALRLLFVEVDGAPEQRIGPPPEPCLPWVDLAALSADRVERELRRLTREEAALPFDLARGPLLRTRLLRLGDARHRLLWTVHHIVFDGESLGLVLADLAALYPALAAGREMELPAPSARIADLARAEAERLRGGEWAEALAGIAVRLGSDLAPLDLPADRPRPALRGERGGVVPLVVPAAIAAPLLDLARSSGVTPYMALLAGFAALLGRLSATTAVRVGTPASLRIGRALQGVVGFAVNTLVVPVDLSGAPAGRRLLDRTREASLAAQAHRDLPFELLVESLTPERDLARQPLVQVSFSFAERALAEVRLGPEIEGRVEEVHNGTAKYDLALALAPAGGDLAGAFGYAADLFEEVTVRRWAGHLTALLAALTADPESPVDDLPLLSSAERHQLAVEWNDTGSREETDLVHRRFAAQAARTPDAVALLAGGVVLTYGELDRRANRLAHRLRRSGIGPESRVALAMGRSAGAIVGLFGVLKAGGAYLVLEEGQPAARLALLLAEAEVGVVVTEPGFSGALPEGVDRIDLDAERQALAHEPGWSPPELATPPNLAYLLFTSGSTGTPKAVAVEHRQLDAYVSGITETLSLASLPGAVSAHVSTLAADLGHTVLFPSLLGGGRLHLVPREIVADPEAVADLFARSPVDVMKIVPSHLATLLAAGPAVLPQRLLVLGGEAADARLLAAVRSDRPDLAVHNHYGPTEATVGVLTQPADRPARGARMGSLPLGRPLPGSRVHLLDTAFHPVPLGVAGEIQIAGRGVARGYLGRPDLTAERFVPDLLGEPGTRLYRTGDRARRLPGGEVEFLGRVDRQVKIRGFRVEPGEVEAALAELPEVREAAVVAASGPGGTRLVGYVVMRAAPGAGPGGDRAAGGAQTRPAGSDSCAPSSPDLLQDLRLGLRHRLPEPLIPSAWVLLDALPRNANGKVDRRALPEPAPEKESPATAASARSPVEELIAGIWSDLLGAAPAPGDDFFAAGGHSLLAARLISRLRQTFEVELPLSAVFEAPTLPGLARRVEAARSAGAPPLPPIPSLPSTGPLPLSHAQERLWFLDRFEPGSAEYNIPYRLELAPGTDPSILGRALAGIVRRHETLRSRFPEAEGLPVAEIGPGIGPLPRVDLASLPGEGGAGEADRLAAAFARCPFDLASGPPLRAVLLERGEDAELLLNVHHIVFDAWSLDVLLRELGALYAAPFSLPELPVQYAGFAAWQRGWLAEGVLSEQLDFWRSRLALGPAPLELPADRPRPAGGLGRSGRGGRRSTVLQRPLAERLGALARERGATPFMVLLAGFAALLSRLSGQLRLTVGTPVANRRRPETEGLIGLFVNLLALPLDLREDPGFADLLGRVRGVTLDAHAHADLPFERLVQELAPERDLGRTPLFQALFNFQHAPQAPGTFPVRAVSEIDSGTAKFDLTLALTAGEGGFVGAFEYAADLFDSTTIGRWSEHLGVLLEAVLAEPGRSLRELPLLANWQRQQLLREWNDTAPFLPAPLLHDAVAARAAAIPHSVALTFEGEHLSAGELTRRANRLARHLRDLGAGPGRRVGLCAERAPEIVVALLAVLRSGAAYLPLDPDYPRERLEWMLEDGGMSILLTQERLGAFLPPLVDERVLFLDADWELVARRSAAPLPDLVGPDDLAYVLYTSGSTGKPKGVEVRHGGAARFLAAMAERPGLAAGDILVAVTTLSFDIALLELFLPLAVGARVELVSRETAADPARLASALATASATALQATPATWRMLLESGWSGRPGLLALSGGEALPRDLAELLLARIAPGGALWNVYGPTETTVWSTVHRVEPGTRQVPVGRPIAGTAVYLLEGLTPVPPGAPGELCIGGEGLACGYRNRHDLTAERFFPDPFGPPGSRLYQTGDLARHLPGGEIEHLGRLDHQVKVRGVRIELGEVEAVLREHPAIRECAVVVREDAVGERRLVACVVARGRAVPRPEGLRGHLRQKLPDSMIPALFLMLDELPLTPNGKVDRKALADRARQELADETEGRAGYVAPSTPVEHILAEVWAEVLRREGVGIHDGFFDLGGDSILAIRLVARAARQGVRFTPRDVFRHPTIATLAALAEMAEVDLGATPGTGPAAEVERRPIPRLARGRALPLSHAQERLWFLDRFAPGSAEYNISYRLELAPGADPAALGRALAEVVRRHEVLRSRFPAAEGLPMAEITEIGAGIGPLPRVDLAGLPTCIRGAAADRLAAALARRPFDLAAGPLRATFLERGAGGEGPGELLLNLHHIVFDAWSLHVLLRELAALYAAPAALPLPPVQYADFAAWQRGWLAEGVLSAQLDFWRSRLADGPPPLDLPADRPRPASRSSRGGRREIVLPQPLAERLVALARERGGTLFMVLLAGFAALLSRLSGQLRLNVGTPVANRRRPEVEGLIGLFVNTLVLPLDLGGAPGFADLLGRVQEVTLDAHAHPDLPFERLVQELEPQRDLGRTPLFQALLNFQSAPRELGSFPVRGVSEVDSGTAKFDLTLALTAREGRLVGAFEYAAALFDATTVGRWSEHLGVLLEAALAEPGVSLRELPLLPTGQRQQLLREWNDTAPFLPAPLLHDAVAARAASAPDRVALTFEGEHLSAGELTRRANRLARHLRDLGAGPGTRVGLCAERAPEIVVALLAILRAGAAYLPLDPDYPRERLEWMLEDGGMSILLIQERLGAFLPPLVDERIVFLDADWDLVARKSAAPLTAFVGPDDLAYVLYTSGSTGKPKGVEVRHGGAARFLAAMAKRPGLTAGDVLVAITTLSFDIALLELFLPLAVGARVELVSRETAADPLRLAATLDAASATALQATPATWRMLLDSGWAGRPGLLALSGGEALPHDLAELLLTRIAPGALWNVYGPTETTVWSTVHRVEPGNRQVPVGRPIAGTTLYLLENLQPVPPGAAGELCIGGEGLARGYRNRPDLTAERFLPDPFGPPGSRLYRTGDLARHLPSGEIEHLGRLDHQVKVRGFRIELGEVEAVLREHPAVRECAVVVREELTGERRLVACVVARGRAVPRPEGLRGHLRHKLPDYMIPALFLPLDELPLTPNGKVDRRALVDRARRELADETAGRAGYVPPSTPVEHILAAVWAEVLRRELVGIHDSFFDLGGDSILAIRLVARAVRHGVRFTPRDIFRHSTIAELAKVAEVDLGEAGRLATVAVGEAVGEGERLPDGGYTPSDFPSAGLDQEELDELLAQLA